VIDSEPAAEYDETLLKGKALAAALGRDLSVLMIDGS
jgi:anthranilate/para-aminobenzoate synthase component I